MESNLAPIWSNQSITCCSRFAYLCGIFEGRQGEIRLRPCTGFGHDADADDRTGFDGGNIRVSILDWRNRGGDVSTGYIPELFFAEEIEGLEYKVGFFLFFFLSSARGI